MAENQKTTIPEKELKLIQKIADSVKNEGAEAFIQSIKSFADKSLVVHARETCVIFLLKKDIEDNICCKKLLSDIEESINSLSDDRKIVEIVFLENYDDLDAKIRVPVQRGRKLKNLELG